MKFALRTGALTDVGRVRSANQDAIITRPSYAAVADGMGGHAGGEIASEVALTTLSNELRNADVDTLLNAVRSANQAIFARAADEPQLFGMGTTICAVAIVEIEGHERVAIINVGDSRVYMLQGDRLTQVTKDHSYVEELVESGQISEAEARTHPRRNIVTRALGIDPNVDVDSWEVTPFVGDRYLLCSDGLFNEVDVDVIRQVLVDVADGKEAAEILVQLANDGGGRDNISVIVADIVDTDSDAVATAEADDDDDAPGEDTAAFPPPLPLPLAALSDGEPTIAAPALGGWLTTDDDPTVATTAVPPPSRPPDVDATLAEPVPRPPARSYWRTGLFLGAIVGVLLVVGAAVYWYARGSYYVSFDNAGAVAVYQGRPDGLLWFDATLVQSYPLQRTQIFDQKIVQDLEAGRLYGNKASAETYATTLAKRLNPTTTVPATTTTLAPTTTTATTTTTVPATTTTLPPTTTVPATTVAPTTVVPATTVAPAAVITFPTTIATAEAPTSAS